MLLICSIDGIRVVSKTKPKAQTCFGSLTTVKRKAHVGYDYSSITTGEFVELVMSSSDHSPLTYVRGICGSIDHRSLINDICVHGALAMVRGRDVFSSDRNSFTYAKCICGALVMTNGTAPCFFKTCNRQSALSYLTCFTLSVKTSNNHE